MLCNIFHTLGKCLNIKMFLNEKLSKEEIRRQRIRRIEPL